MHFLIYLRLGWFDFDLFYLVSPFRMPSPRCRSQLVQWKQVYTYVLGTFVLFFSVIVWGRTRWFSYYAYLVFCLAVLLNYFTLRVLLLLHISGLLEFAPVTTNRHLSECCCCCCYRMRLIATMQSGHRTGAKISGAADYVRKETGKDNTHNN